MNKFKSKKFVRNKNKKSQDISICPVCKNTGNIIESWIDKYEHTKNIEYECPNCHCEYVKYVGI